MSSLCWSTTWQSVAKSASAQPGIITWILTIIAPTVGDFSILLTATHHSGDALRLARLFLPLGRNFFYLDIVFQRILNDRPISAEFYLGNTTKLMRLFPDRFISLCVCPNYQKTTLSELDRMVFFNVIQDLPARRIAL